MDNKPFPQLKLFKHGWQSIFSKTKGGLVGGAQARTILRSSTSVFHWEQNIVSQTLKSVAENAFIEWRMRRKESLLHISDSFRGLNQYRQALDRVQSLGEFVLDVSKELLTYAESLSPDMAYRDKHIPIEINVSDSETIRLEKRAEQRTGKRILFFNSENGLRLRFKYGMNLPEHMRDAALWCAYLKTVVMEKGGRRTSDKCKNCHVPLCMCSRGTKTRASWDFWH